MKKIKMVGLDLDGTTFNEQKKISAVDRDRSGSRYDWLWCLQGRRVDRFK